MILYELLLGCRPFVGSPVAVMQQVLAGELRAPRALHESVPPAVEAVVLPALTTDPTRRYPDARPLARDLAACLT